jgi:hypothetical protein
LFSAIFVALNMTACCSIGHAGIQDPFDPRCAGHVLNQVFVKSACLLLPPLIIVSATTYHFQCREVSSQVWVCCDDSDYAGSDANEVNAFLTCTLFVSEF